MNFDVVRNRIGLSPQLWATEVPSDVPVDRLPPQLRDLPVEVPVEVPELVELVVLSPEVSATLSPSLVVVLFV